MKLKIKRFLLLTLCAGILWGQSGIVQAAGLSRPKLTKLTFDKDYYYQTYGDLQGVLANDYQTLYDHYIEFGMREGRSGSAEFNCAAYRNNYADLNAAFGDNYSAYCVHYETYGKAEGRNAGGTGTVVSQSAPQPAGKVIGTYTTLYDADIPRASNVILAASRINGVVVQPGESFSYNQTILPRTAANGYVEAPVIVNKKYVPGIGGGICQVSSTLYAAMLTAGLPATERHPHSLAVSYIPAGMDATISGSALDLKFVNIFAEPLRIEASANNGVLTINICR